jgi:hypothetical protein
MPESIGEARIPEVVRLRLAGKNQRDIAAELGVHASTISLTLKRPDVVALIDAANRESYELIVQQRGRLALAALARLEKLMNGDAEGDGPPPVTSKGEYCVPANVQRQAAADILGACGITKVVAVQFPNSAPSLQLALEGLDVEQLKAVAWGEPTDAEELAAGRMIDVTPDDVQALDEPNEAK